MGAQKSVEDGAAGIVWLATLPTIVPAEVFGTGPRLRFEQAANSEASNLC